MTYDPTYYQNRKQEIQQDYQKLIFEAYEDIERAVVKKFNKAQEMQKKLQELETKEKESLEANKKTPEVPEPAKPAKSKKLP